MSLGRQARAHPVGRPCCPHCRRPEQVCVCSELRPIASHTRVVFLQHPREARMPVSTCRLAHRSLPNSEMHVALRPEGSPRLEALAAAPGAMLLFPGPGAIDVTELASPPRTLLVVDGTWINARKLVDRSPLLSALPRVGFTPLQPGNYRIRKEPAEHCLSTIEAVAYVLEVLEAAPGRFTPILGSFERMVDLQLEYIARRPKTRRDRPSKPMAEHRAAIERLRGLGEHRVLVFADGNAWSDGSGPSGPAELLHWVAVRPSGARFESLLRPHKLVAAYVPHRLGVSPEALESGENRDAARARWRQFVSEGDTLVSWGQFSQDLLRTEGIDAGDHLDLKRLAAAVVNARLGGVESLAERLDGPLPANAGHAARTIEALDVVVRGLVDGRLG